MFDWTQIDTTPTTQPSLTSLDSWQCAIPLTDHVIIEVKGPDAEKFLQGQCTCDFKAINAGAFSLGAHCNVKGRMVSSFTAAKLGQDGFGLRVHRSNAVNALATLKKYAVFSKVSLAISETLAPIVTFNLENSAVTSVKASAGEWAVLEAAGAPVLGTSLVHAQGVQELWLSKDLIQAILNSSPIADSSAWLAYTTANGIAEVTSESTEMFIPQEINLQLLNGVSFNKGCYTGQEIIARMHYKATLKKHMYRAQHTAPAPAVGSQVINGEGKSVGQVVQSVSTPQGADILVLALDSSLNDQNVHCEANPEQKLQWHPLPYAIPLTEN